LQVTLKNLNSPEYTTEFGTVRQPPRDGQYLWVQVALENLTEKVLSLPRVDRFGLLFHDQELEATYGHRQNFPDYTSQESSLYPDQSLEAWLRFEVSAEAQASDLLFAFSPESPLVSLDAPSQTDSWANHPVFL
jgi:hypothetical protein